MKHKGRGFTCLFAVIAGVLISAVCLRLVLSGSLEAYTDKVRTDAQTERLRPPLREANNAESFITSGPEATPDPIFPGQELPAGESEPPYAGVITENLYLAGYVASQEAEKEVEYTCYIRYGEWPEYILKTYMECDFGYMGYAWYGVVYMPGGTPIIFNRMRNDEIWTQRSMDEAVYAFLDDQAGDATADLKDLIMTYMMEWLDMGYVDWEDYG